MTEISLLGIRFGKLRMRFTSSVSARGIEGRLEDWVATLIQDCAPGANLS